MFGSPRRQAWRAGVPYEHVMERLGFQRLAPAGDWLSRFNIAQGYAVGDLVILSGQVAVDESGNLISESVETQAEAICDHIETALAAVGSDLDSVIKLTTYLTDIETLADYIRVYHRRMHAPYPAATAVEVNALALPGARVEVDAIAARGQSRSAARTAGTESG